MDLFRGFAFPEANSPWFLEKLYLYFYRLTSVESFQKFSPGIICNSAVIEKHYSKSPERCVIELKEPEASRQNKCRVWTNLWVWFVWDKPASVTFLVSCISQLFDSGSCSSRTTFGFSLFFFGRYWVTENTPPGSPFLDIRWYWDLQHYAVNCKVTVMIEITIKVHWISLLQINQEEHTKIYWIPNIKI